MKKIVMFGMVFAFLTLSFVPQNASAGAEPFIGEIMMVGFTFCPRGWVEADGQLLSISQNTALFSLYGTTYGGDGRTTFGLPDLRGRVSIHTGQGPGLTNRPLGSKGGEEEVDLTVDQLAAHTHALMASSKRANSRRPGGKVLAKVQPGEKAYRESESLVPMDVSAIEEEGQGDPVPNMQPYLVIRYCIALQGLFPSRN